MCHGNGACKADRVVPKTNKNEPKCSVTWGVGPIGAAKQQLCAGGSDLQPTFKGSPKTQRPEKKKNRQQTSSKEAMPGLTAGAAFIATTHHARASEAGQKAAAPETVHPRLYKSKRCIDNNDNNNSLSSSTKWKPPSAPRVRSDSRLFRPRFGLVLVTSRLLLLAELEVLAARDDQLLLGLALLALQPKGHLLGGLGLREGGEIDAGMMARSMVKKRCGR